MSKPILYVKAKKIDPPIPYVQVRLSAEEKAEFEAAAGKAGFRETTRINVSAYVRWLHREHVKTTGGK